MDANDPARDGGQTRRPSAYAPPPAPWTAQPPSAPAPARASGSPVLGILSLSFAGLAVLLALVPPIALTAWLPAVSAIVLGIVALVRRRGAHGLAIAGIAVGGFAGVLSFVVVVVSVALLGVVQSLVPALPRADERPYAQDESPWLAVPESVGHSPQNAIPFAQPVEVVSTSTSEAVWNLSIAAPEDATATMAAAGETPLHGRFVAVAVTVQNLTPRAINVEPGSYYLPYVELYTTADEYLETSPRLPTPLGTTVYDLATVHAGDTVTYYELFDTAEPLAGLQVGAYLSGGDELYFGVSR